MWFMYILSWVATIIQISFVTLAIGTFYKKIVFDHLIILHASTVFPFPASLYLSFLFSSPTLLIEACAINPARGLRECCELLTGVWAEPQLQ